MSASQEFHDQGFTVASGFFSRAEAGALLSEVERRMVHEGTQDKATEGGLIFTANVFKQTRFVQSFLAQQRLVDFLKPIAGGDLPVRWEQVVS